MRGRPPAREAPLTSPAGAASACHRCARALAPGEGGPVARFYRLVAGLSLGPVHAGMWLWEDLSRDYCRRCRRWLSALSIVLGVMVLSLAVLGVRWGIKSGIL